MSADLETLVKNATAAQTAEILSAFKQELAKLQVECQQGFLALQALGNENMVATGAVSAAISTLTATVAGSSRSTKKTADPAAAATTTEGAAAPSPENKFPATILFWFNACMKSPDFAQQILAKMETAFPTDNIKEQVEKSFAANPVPNRVKHDADFMWKHLKNNSKAGGGKKLMDELREQYNNAKKEHTDKLQTGSVEQKVEASTPV